MIRELDGIELGPRLPVPMELENTGDAGQRKAWVGYLAQVAERGGSR